MSANTTPTKPRSATTASRAATNSHFTRSSKNQSSSVVASPATPSSSTSSASSSVVAPKSPMTTTLTAQFNGLHIAPLPSAASATASTEAAATTTTTAASSSSSSSSTGLVYDPRCLLHEANYSHVEQPARASSSMKLLETNGLYARCRHVPARLATDAELQSAHPPSHIAMIDASAKAEYGAPEPDSETEGDDRIYPDCHFLDSDTYVNQYSAEAARLSIGGLIDLIELVIQGKLKNAFAIVRPPGHHADAVTSRGFCLYNTVGVAAAHIQATHPDTMKRILIVDFDVHHGDGTQSLFYDNPNVLYFSLHRHQHGAFYPHTGKADECGTANALGKNINVPLNYKGLGDAEYIEVFKTILLPVISEWKPELILTSAGFDCAQGDPLGGMEVSTECFGYLTSLMSSSVPHGRIVMALEGGYNIRAVSEGISSCVKALLGDPLDPLPNAHEFLGKREIAKLQQRNELFRKDLLECVQIQQKYWKCLRSVEQELAARILATAAQSEVATSSSASAATSTPSSSPTKPAAPSSSSSSSALTSSTTTNMAVAAPSQPYIDIMLLNSLQPSKDIIYASLFEQARSFLHLYDSRGKPCVGHILRAASAVYEFRDDPPPPSAEQQQLLITVAESFEAAPPAASLEVLTVNLEPLRDAFSSHETGLTAGQLTQCTTPASLWRTAAEYEKQRK